MFTAYFILGWVVILFLVDGYLLLAKDYRATVSATLWRLGRDYQVITLLIGICIGHVFWVNEAAVIEAVKEKCGVDMSKDKP